MSLLQHENNDIVVDAVNLMYELTQANESLSEEEDESKALTLHQHFIVRHSLHFIFCRVARCTT